MILIGFLLLAVIAACIACFRPAWFWAVYVIAPVLLEIPAIFLSYNINAIPLGPLLVRVTDVGTFGLLIGVIFHGLRHGFQALKRDPDGYCVAAILFFLLLKVLVTVAFGRDVILANPISSQALGGLVAATGDIRDSLMALVLPVYVYMTKESYDLKKLGWPCICASCVILLKAAISIAVTRTIWSANAEDRFINAHEAVHLTIFSFILFFLSVPRLSPSLRRSFALGIFAVSLIANHRAQWVAALASISVFVLIICLGRPFVGNPKLNRLLVTGFCLFLGMLLVGSSFVESFAQQFPLFGDIAVRLYAITDPSRDADASWRQALWQDRIRQVGDNWPWGRLLGDRHPVFFHGGWLLVPDHSAYVSIYELGGVILCVLVGIFWLRIIQVSVRRVLLAKDTEQMWVPLVALSITAASLAFGVAYDFPWIGPSLALVFTLGQAGTRVHRE